MKIHRFSYFHHLDLKYTRAYIVHTNAALNVGIAPEQIVEVCTHCIPYAGFPRVLNALFTVKAVFEERNVL
ncbi:MAG: carboxymuconolactone decarboxylase family protein [Veillonella sp.]|nr:carboxymuconolactone decarboxylase family protein [Veillonella sp.]